MAVPAPRLVPIESPAAWRGAELAGRSDWIHVLDAGERRELLEALAHARSGGRARSELRREDFPLPGLAPRVEGWLETLECGRGFVNVRGFPVEGRSLEEVEWLYWGLGLHLGSAVSQNAAGDLLGHVRDTGADPTDPGVRLYKTRVELGFHSDGADVVGLLCLRAGRSGGALRLVSTASLYNEILGRRPELVPILYQPFYWDRNEEQGPGEEPFFRLPICHAAAQGVSFFYIPWYIRKAQRHPEVPRLSREQQELLDLIDEIAEDPALHLEMRLRPGEINWLKNNTALHSRTAYVDAPEPEHKRHQLRLWLRARGFGDADPRVLGGIPKRSGVRSDAEELGR